MRERREGIRHILTPCAALLGPREHEIRIRDGSWYNGFSPHWCDPAARPGRSIDCEALSWVTSWLGRGSAALLSRWPP